MAAGSAMGVVLAGGQGKRIGGDKAIVELEGRALVDYPLAVLREVLGDVAVVAKRETALPILASDVRVWVEPDRPRHPLTGIVHALRCAGGRPVFVCAADMALLDAETIETILAAPRGTPPAGAAPEVDGRLEPLCAVYEAAALRALERFEPEARAADAARAAGVQGIAFDDPAPFFNINAPEDVLQASALLHRRRGAV